MRQEWPLHSGCEPRKLPIIYANPAFEKITGYSTVEPIGDETLFLLRNGARPANPLDMRAMLQGVRRSTGRAEYRKGVIKCWAEFRLCR